MRRYLIVLCACLAWASLAGCADGDALLLKPDLSASGGDIRIVRAEPSEVAPGGAIVLYGKGFDATTDIVVFGEEERTPYTDEAEAETEEDDSDTDKAITASDNAETGTKMSFDVPDDAEDGAVWIFVERGDVKSNRVKITVDSSLKEEAPQPPAEPAVTPPTPITDPSTEGETTGTGDPQTQPEDDPQDGNDGASTGTDQAPTGHLTFRLIDQREQIRKFLENARKWGLVNN